MKHQIRGIKILNRKQLIQVLRSYYHSLLLPPTVKKIVSFGIHNVIGKIFNKSRWRLTGTSHFKHPDFKPATIIDDHHDYFFWGVIDWDFRHQRPQQLASSIVQSGRRVFYISPTLVDDAPAGFQATPLDGSGRLFQIHLFAKTAPIIYSKAPSTEIIEQLRKSIGEVLEWADCKRIQSVVQHPFWYDIASVLPNSRLVYDCMDYHEGFGNNDESLIKLEKKLFKGAELTITTSTWLDNMVAPHATRHSLIRNACDYDHFSAIPASVYCDRQGRRIIGYYGAIAEWFDLDLVAAAAKQHPNCCVLLIGADTINARQRLRGLSNIEFLGEVAYDDLPKYLYAFDVCLLPFKISPLTLATNPVKVYEYLSAGKPVVSVSLPEMTQFEDMIYVAEGREEFLKKLELALREQEAETLIQNRKAFARDQTWKHRAEEFIQVAESSQHDPKVSIIVITYNNVDLTRACLSSLSKHCQYDNLEIIVVDNASTDGTRIFLKQWADSDPRHSLILNDDNRGFAPANNQGLNVATGDYLIMLNNDTYATPGWVRTLMNHLRRDKTIGLICPVTNNIGNEAKIDITYDSMDEMLTMSASYTRGHIGMTYPLRTAAFFCVMMPRETFKRVGFLDEAFTPGFFEDDDYCRRVEQAGLRIACAEDVFIHHHLSASFDKLRDRERQKLFEKNRKIYEAKWGTWFPHRYRDKNIS